MIEPKVTLIDYTGKTSADPMFGAKKLLFTKNTRLEQSTDNWDNTHSMSDEEVLDALTYVRDSVRSSWEFMEFTFMIGNVSRNFTHQLVRTRTASYAQQSQRVVDMSGFDYVTPPVIAGSPEMTKKYNEQMESANKAYTELLEMGAPAQDARNVLPTSVCTSILVSVNLRTLADLALKRDNPRAEGEYFKVFRQIADRVIEALPWTEMFLYPPRLATPELDALLMELRGDKSPVDKPKLNQIMKEIDRLKKTWG